MALVVQTVADGQKDAPNSTQTMLPSVLVPHEQAGPQSSGPGGRQREGIAVVQLPFRKHEPSWQTWVAVQPVPQLPQLASSVFRLRQTSLQFVNPLAQMQLLF